MHLQANEHAIEDIISRDTELSPHRGNAKQWQQGDDNMGYFLVEILKLAKILFWLL